MFIVSITNISISRILYMAKLIIKINKTEDTKIINSNHYFSNNHTQHTLILTY